LKTLTPAAQRTITDDWSRSFGGLGIYRPLRLLRRVGPLLEGITLERSSGNVDYLPTFHVHALTRPFDSVMLTLAHPLRTERTHALERISVAQHEARYPEAAARLLRQAPLPLSGDLKLEDVLAAYRAAADRPGTHYEPELYEDMVSFCAWAGQSAYAEAILLVAVAKMQQWPSGVLAAMGGLAPLQERLASEIADPAGLRRRADDQALALGASDLPVAELVA
jgi:hypothetical protein